MMEHVSWFEAISFAIITTLLLIIAGSYLTMTEIFWFITSSVMLIMLIGIAIIAYWLWKNTNFFNKP
jgi:general stress protein CsbA